ncbi:hypothetical protein I6A81_00175 [Frankia sp. CN7]|nr:hypothetical protein [Frankia nepalensis]
MAVAAAVLGVALAPPALAAPVHIENWNNICLGIHGSSIYPGSPAAVGTCVNTPTQNWDKINLVPLNKGGTTVIAMQFRNRTVNQLCLGVTGVPTTGDKALVQGACQPTSDLSQLWYWSSSSPSWNQLKNAKSDKCAGISGTRVYEQPCVSGAHQLWKTY